MGPDIVEVLCFLHGETDKAFYVSDTGERQQAVWVPTSQLEGYEYKSGSKIELSMPEWLALEKGFI